MTFAGERDHSRLLANRKYCAKGSGIYRIIFLSRYFSRETASISRSSAPSGKLDVTNPMIKPVRSLCHFATVIQKLIEQDDAQDATSSESPVFMTISEAVRFNARVFLDPFLDSLVMNRALYACYLYFSNRQRDKRIIIFI